MSDIKANIAEQVVKVVSAGTGVGTMKENYGDSLRILLTACSLVRLIACANIANLLLAQGASCRPQTSVRLPSARHVSVLFANRQPNAWSCRFWGDRRLGSRVLRRQSHRGPHLSQRSICPIDAKLSLPVLAFAFTVSLITGVLFGVAPAWFTSHADPVEALRGANRSMRDQVAFSQKTLVVLQATLSIVLLAAPAC